MQRLYIIFGEVYGDYDRNPSYNRKKLNRPDPSMTLIKDLIHIPERVQKGDFVLRLTEGVDRAKETLENYVVTPELEGCFNSALIFIRSALQANSSKATYLHGSFGSGKSHFMAVLHLILQGNVEARKVKKLAPVVTKHNEWIEGKRFLLVPYHMVGATDMESGILGGYVDFIRRTYPDAPIPGVYLGEGLFRDAREIRAGMGDEAFFARLNQAGNSSESGWGDLDNGWDAERFAAAVATPPMPVDQDERKQLTFEETVKLQERQSLIGALVKSFFGSYQNVSDGQQEKFVSLDRGLSIISRHARSLGYDAIILFLDELILWLASRATDLKFVHQEGQKLAKLVEAQTSDRPIPIVSFVARQRDLSELIGDSVPGVERLNFGDALKHWEGRFDRINLEDRNLPAIAEERILKCKTPAARAELDAAFQQTKMREAVMNTLLTTEGDREMFRKVYPFSPALVQTLIAISNVLQRERTALKIMMQLLVNQQETLKLGDIIPVGDLFDAIAHGDEAFSPETAIHFNNAKRLYHQKLLPFLEKKHGMRLEEIEVPTNNPKYTAFNNDSRLFKTLLLSALVPDVESLRSLNAERLAALNYGTIKTPVPGTERQIVLKLCGDCAASGVGEIRISDETNPTISLQLSGVDTETIIEQARSIDSRGNRIQLIREMMFKQLGIGSAEQLLRAASEYEREYNFDWRGTKRSCVVLFRNIRDLPDASLENESDFWKLVIDFPFEEGHTPRDDLGRLQEFKEKFADVSTRTICWVPAFFSDDAQTDLGKLVILEHILTGDRFSQYSNHSPQDRQSAKSLLENQRSMLRQRVQNHLDAAYGLQVTSPDSLDPSRTLELHERFVSLYPGLELQPPAAARLEGAMLNLLDRSLAFDFPAAPIFELDVNKVSNLDKVYQATSAAARDPDYRTPVDKSIRLLVRQIANPLRLAEMRQDDTHLVLDQYWKTHFTRKSEGGRITVSQLREWIDQPKAMGLPKEVQNLLILTFAAQTNRTFYLHNVPYQDATLKDIRNECELREQKLPDETQWQLAVQQAGSILGIQISPLCNASNVADLESKATQRSVACRDAVERYTQTLRTCLERLGVDPSSDRLKTAIAALALVEQISSSQADDMAKILAEVTVATSEAAMQDCLNKAALLVTALETTDWEVFEFIATLVDDRQQAAVEIRQMVEEILCTDEYVMPLGTLKAAQTKARALLTKPAPPSTEKAIDDGSPTPQPDPPLPPPKPIQKRGKQVVNQGAQENLEMATAQKLLLELTQNLKAEQTIRLSISWIIEEGSNTIL